MDSPEDENSLQSENFLECEKQKPSVSDAGIQLDLPDLIDDSKSESETDDSNQSIQDELDDLDMKLPVSIQNCVSSGVHVSSEVVVITNAGTSFLNDQKIPLTPIHTSDPGEPLSKRICLEQDGQTYILALQDGMDGLTGVMELRQKSLPPVGAAQLLNTHENAGLSPKHGINQNWFTSKEDKTIFHNKGHIWKQGMWAKEEIELLEHNIRQYCEEHGVTDPATIIFEMSKDERKDFYRTVAKGLNRPLFSVYRRVIRMYDNKNHVGKYTQEELERLKKLRSVYGNDWQAIGAAMGRSASSIKDRCRLMKDNCNQGKWLPAEERRLAEAVYDLANALPGEMISTGLSWALVAERVGTRSEKQCRTKWLNYLNWKEAGGTDWTRDDDTTLICRVCSLNVPDENQVDWSELAKGWSSVRSPQWLRGKWWSLKRHVPNSNIVSFQEVCDYLYQHFFLKMRIKEEGSVSSPVESQTDALTLQPSQLLARTKPAILRSVALSATPPPTGIVVTTAAQACPAPVISLAGTPVDADGVDVATPTATLPSVSMGPMLQTLEVLPQSIHLATNPQTFLLAAHPQPSIPLTTSLSPSQIIIQAVTTENLQRNENVTVQMNTPPQIIINASNPAALTSLASTQIPSAPSSPPDVEHDSLEDHHSLMEEESYETRTIDDRDIDQVREIDGVEEQEGSRCKNDVSSHLILADPMLAASHSPEMGVSDMESEKGHAGDDSLDHVSTSDG